MLTALTKDTVILHEIKKYTLSATPETDQDGIDIKTRNSANELIGIAIDFKATNDAGANLAECSEAINVRLKAKKEGVLGQEVPGDYFKFDESLPFFERWAPLNLDPKGNELRLVFNHNTNILPFAEYDIYVNIYLLYKEH